ALSSSRALASSLASGWLRELVYRVVVCVGDVRASLRVERFGNEVEQVAIGARRDAEDPQVGDISEVHRCGSDLCPRPDNAGRAPTLRTACHYPRLTLMGGAARTHAADCRARYGRVLSTALPPTAARKPRRYVRMHRVPRASGPGRSGLPSTFVHKN